MADCRSQISINLELDDMSDNGMEIEKLRRTLEESLKEMPENLRLFSISMRSLYSNKNFSTSTDVSHEITKLRDDTRQDVEVYLKVILPLTTKFVSAVKKFFEYYDALTYEEWCYSLPDILESIKNNEDLAKTLLEMYEEIIALLKTREREATIIMTKYEDLQTEYENAQTEFENKARTKRKWAFGLAFIPVVNLIATPILQSYAKQDSAKAIAAEEESKIHKDAAFVVAESLHPPLVNFVHGLTKATEFFQTMEIEMNSLEDRGKDSKLAHYKIMRNNVQKITPASHVFYAALPAIRTDFESIPDGDTDTQKKYVKSWAEKKLKKIEEKRANTRKQFYDVVKGIRGISLKPIMASSSHNTDE